MTHIQIAFHNEWDQLLKPVKTKNKIAYAALQLCLGMYCYPHIHCIVSALKKLTATNEINFGAGLNSDQRVSTIRMECTTTTTGSSFSCKDDFVHLTFSSLICVLLVNPATHLAPLFLSLHSVEGHRLHLKQLANGTEAKSRTKLWPPKCSGTDTKQNRTSSCAIAHQPPKPTQPGK